jgi:Protein of unknown function (DUF3047)
MNRLTAAVLAVFALAAVPLPVALPVPPVVAQGNSVLVEDWSKQPVGKTGVPNGWQVQSWGSPKYDFVIEADGQARVLHMKSDNEGSTINKEVKIDLKGTCVLQWRWKAVTLPKGGDSRKKETDDQGVQIYVTFPRFPQAVRSRIIGYVWDTTAPAGTFVRSEKSGTVTYVVVRSGAAGLGEWHTESRNVCEDYKKIYSEEPAEPVGAVSVAIDSNDTKSTAESYVGEILFKKP